MAVSAIMKVLVFVFVLIPCGRLSWLYVRFSVHANISHCVVSYRTEKYIGRFCSTSCCLFSCLIWSQSDCLICTWAIHRSVHNHIVIIIMSVVSATTERENGLK